MCVWCVRVRVCCLLFVVCVFVRYVVVSCVCGVCGVVCVCLLCSVCGVFVVWCVCMYSVGV